MKSIPPHQSIWSSVAAYALIRALAWLRQEPGPLAIAAENRQSAVTFGLKPKVEHEHGLAGWWAVFRDAALRWIDHKAATLGAALAYYSVFSIGPLMLIAIAVAGFFFGADAVRGQVSSQLVGLLGESGAKAVEAMLAGASQRQEGILATIIGLVTLLLGATEWSSSSKTLSTPSGRPRRPPAPASGALPGAIWSPLLACSPWAFYC